MIPELKTESFWLAVGLLGQAMFSARFLIQWIASERLRRSFIPPAFWYFSLAGGVALLAYALQRADPVFIVGQVFGLFVYGRNLYLDVAQKRPRAGDGERPCNEPA